MSSDWHVKGPLPPDEDQGHWVLPLVLTIRCIAVIIVALRLYTRSVAKKTAGWDDVCITISVVITVFGGIDDILRTRRGWGRHIEYIKPPDIVFINEWMFIGEQANFGSLFFIRMSICLFVLRLLPEAQKWPRVFTYVAMGANAVSTVVNCIIFGVRCIPVQGIFDMTLHAKCLTMKELAIAFGCASAGGVICDFLVIIIPVFVIRNLQMNKHTKIGISIIMCLSFLTALCSIGKMVTTINIMDPIHDTVPVFLFSFFEEACGIICASMPAMRQLYKHVKSRRQGHKRLLDHGDSHPYSAGSHTGEKSDKRVKSPDIELRSLDEIDHIDVGRGRPMVQSRSAFD